MFANTVTIRDNVVEGSLASSTSFGAPHADAVQFLGNAVADWDDIIFERNIFFARYPDRDNQMMFIAGMGAGLFFNEIQVLGNVIVSPGGPSTGVRIGSPKNAIIRGNTVISHLGDTAQGPSILLGETETSGTHTVENNVADGIDIPGPQTNVTNNLVLGVGGSTVAYTTAFDGTTFDPETRAEVLSELSMKTGGPLDLATNIGAIGSGYITFPTTSPGNYGVTHSLAPPAFAPTDIASLFSWWEPSVATMSETSGGSYGDVIDADPVGKYLDRSSNAHVASIADTGFRPTYNELVSGAKVLTTTVGAKSQLDVPTLVTSNDGSLTVIVGADITNTSDRQYVIYGGNGGGATSNILGIAFSADNRGMGVFDGTAWRNFEDSQSPDGPHVWTWVLDGPAGTSKGYRDGVLIGTSGYAPNTLKAGVKLFARDDSSENFISGDFGTLLVFDTTLSDADRGDADTYVGLNL